MGKTEATKLILSSALRGMGAGFSFGNIEILRRKAKDTIVGYIQRVEWF